jgi:hypothetical protein
LTWVQRAFGIDGVDLMIHAGVTFAVMAVGSSIWSHAGAEVMLATVSGVSLVVLGVRRRLALRRRPPEGAVEAAVERVAELEARVAELEQGEFRLNELEERLDFAERLLAQRREAVQLPDLGSGR